MLQFVCSIWSPYDNMLQLICSIWSHYDDTLKYVYLATIRYITATFLSSMANVNKRWRHLGDTLSIWQIVNKQRDWSRRAYKMSTNNAIGRGVPTTNGVFWWTTDDLVSYRILACKMKDLRGLVWVKRRLGESISTSLASSEATGSTGPWAPEMLHYLSGWRPKGATIH